MNSTNYAFKNSQASVAGTKIVGSAHCGFIQLLGTKKTQLVSNSSALAQHSGASEIFSATNKAKHCRFARTRARVRGVKCTNSNLCGLN